MAARERKLQRSSHMYAADRKHHAATSTGRLEADRHARLGHRLPGRRHVWDPEIVHFFRRTLPRARNPTHLRHGTCRMTLQHELRLIVKSFLFNDF